MNPQKQVFTALYSLPVVETLQLPNRAELLPKIESGEVDHLDFRARVFTQGPNANFVTFNDTDLPAFAASFEGQPFLRDHNRFEIEARDGTILASAMEGLDMIQDIRLTTREGMTALVEGQIDRFSVSWDAEDVFCTICNISWRSLACPHWPGKTYATPSGDQVCYLLFTKPTGLETSAVNVPAVEGTGIIMSLAANKFDIVRGALTTASNEKPQVPEQPTGQAPETVESLPDEAAQVRRNSLARRLVLAEASYPTQGATMNNVREFLKKRADCLTAARNLHELAETEGRDLTNEERTEFERQLSEAESIGQQIETLQAERERLLQAESSLQTNSSDAVKPESGKNAKQKSLAEFNQLTAAERMAFVKAGGAIQD